MSDRRKKDIDWTVAEEDGRVPTWERVIVAVLMDVRDELKRLNTLLYCHNFTGIPQTLRAIRKNTTKKKRAAAVRKLRAV